MISHFQRKTVIIRDSESLSSTSVYYYDYMKGSKWARKRSCNNEKLTYNQNNCAHTFPPIIKQKYCPKKGDKFSIPSQLASSSSPSCLSNLNQNYIKRIENSSWQLFSEGFWLTFTKTLSLTLEGISRVFFWWG